MPRPFNGAIKLDVRQRRVAEELAARPRLRDAAAMRPTRQHRRVRVVVASGALAAALSANPALAAQSATTSPAAARNPVAVASPQTSGSTPQQPVAGIAHWEGLTGDWGGLRTRSKEKGVVLDSSLTQFYQAVAKGGAETGGEYNGTAQVKLELDFGKLAGWQFWSAEIKGEWRFGGPLLTAAGTINPVNTAAMIPGADGSKFSVTAVNLTRLFPIDLKTGKLLALSFGRYNLVDLLDEDFFAGGGTERFFNIAQIGPLTVLRQVPLITNAINVAYIRGGEPFITFSVLDPNDHSLDSGLGELFEDGVTFSPGITVPTKYFGKTAKHSFGAAITTKKYTPFDVIRQIIIPGPPIIPIEPQGGSWSINYVFRQYIVERGARDGWGVFSQISFADRATSPITVFFDIGLGGNGLIAARPRDEFGVSYAYTDLSEDLKDNLNLITLGGHPVRAEHQFEVFYDLHVFPWLQLTGDMQIIRPTSSSADTAFVPGVRLRVAF
jgi:porin